MSDYEVKLGRIINMDQTAVDLAGILNKSSRIRVKSHLRMPTKSTAELSMLIIRLGPLGESNPTMQVEKPTYLLLP